MNLFKNIYNYVIYNSTTLIYGSSNFSLLFFNSLFSIFILRYVNPEDFGLYNKVVLISSYIVLLNMSIGVIIQKDIPGMLSTNRKDEALDILKNAKGFFLIILVPISIILSSYIIYSLLNSNYLNSLAGLLIIINIWQFIYVNKYLKLLYRTSNEFNNLSKAQFYSSFLYIPSLLSVFFFNYLGLYIKHIIIFLFEFSYLTINAPFRLKPSFNKKKILKLLKTSSSIFFVNLFFNNYFLLIITFSSIYFDLKTFGFFSLFFLIVNAFNKLIVSIDKVFYISFSETVYKKNKLKKSIFDFILNTLLPFVSLYILAALILSFFIDDFISLLAPKYEQAITIIKLTLFYVTFLFFKFFNVIYDVLNMQKQKFYSILIKYTTSALIICFNFAFNSVSPEQIIQILIFSEIVVIIYNTSILINLKKS